ncbi:YceI family protein [Arundinibacter roseus]|uniref:Polyisoprenoid-binding protein n=1 Tax=Arundinibacter roseus TaxID=2070510 RepID=A0A4V2XAJ6_9BACT|nr:YceI family protein [Arundinibacter roseus]TDB67935.1 polyisoprenoid-binding protein [Arundinibacter roseus]
MKKTLLSLALLAGSFGAFAQTWKMDKSHSKLGFTVTHLMISEVDGNFKNFDVVLTSAKEDFSDASLVLTADIASIDTDNERRDTHLKSADFFDAATHPTMTFKSKSVKKVADKKYSLAGDLTMHGVTKPVTMDMTLMGTRENPRTKKPMAAFKVTGTINRIDFGVGTSSATVSDEVEIKGVGEFTKE